MQNKTWGYCTCLYLQLLMCFSSFNVMSNVLFLMHLNLMNIKSNIFIHSFNLHTFLEQLVHGKVFLLGLNSPIRRF